MNNSILLSLLAGSLFLASCDSESAGTSSASSTTSSSNAALANDVDTISYSLGVTFATGMKDRAPFELNSAMLQKAIGDVFAEQTIMTVQEAEENLMKYGKKLEAANAKKKVGAGRAFLEENKNNEGVVVLPSGLQYLVIKQGDGPTPSITSRVTTHYSGTLLDGTVFDSSYERGQPATFAVNGVIPGWTEALQLMPVGSKWKLFIPSELAYGERGGGSVIGPNETLIFEVELLSIED